MPVRSKIWFGLPVFVFLASTAAHGQPELSTSFKLEHETGTGLSVRRWTIRVDQVRAIDALVVQANPARYKVVIAAPGDSSVGGYSLRRFLHDERAIAALSGGFMRSLYPAVPSGFLKIDGQILNTTAKPVERDAVLNGVACFDGSDQRNLKISRIDDTALIDRSPSCLQSGPVLVANGRTAAELPEFRGVQGWPFSTGAYRRTFIAVNSEGHVFLGATSGASLSDLQAFISSPSPKGLGAYAALNLSGDETSGILAELGAAYTEGNVNVLLANAVLVKANE